MLALRYFWPSLVCIKRRGAWSSVSPKYCRRDSETFMQILTVLFKIEIKWIKTYMEKSQPGRHLDWLQDPLTESLYPSLCIAQQHPYNLTGKHLAPCWSSQKAWPVQWNYLLSRHSKVKSNEIGTYVEKFTLLLTNQNCTKFVPWWYIIWGHRSESKQQQQ